MKICLTCEGISATDRELCGTCGTPLLATDTVHYPLRRGEEDSAHPLLGSRLDGKFRIASVLGRGGMGTVFRAIHEVSLVPVALKLLHPRYGARSDYREAFLAEARKAGRVVHDHCARILDVGEAEDGTIYIAMELAEGETLEDWIQGDPPLQPATVVDILIQVCRALVAAHAAGLVHRDLSTRNVMVTGRDGEPFVKILDFGIAKAAAAVAREGAGELAGEPAGFANPAYSAPEHLEARPVDARADLYSLGVIAYQALTGELPVTGADARETAQHTMAGKLEPLPALPGVPRRLQRLVQRLLARDPERRPASSADVLRELESIRARGSSRLARTAPIALLIALALVVLSGVAGREPFLTPTAGSSLELAAALPRSAPTFHLQSRELNEVHFQFGGFRPADLQVELSRDGMTLLQQRLEPVVHPEAGRLTLSVAQRSWPDVLEGLRQACRDGAVDLQFGLRGGAVLGAARLLVDDEPPELVCRLENVEGEEPVLRGTTVLECEVRDRSGVDELTASLVFDESSPGRPSKVSVDLPLQGGRIALGSLLSPLLPGNSDRGPGILEVGAVDGAGNVRHWPLRFSHCDPAAPELLSVTSATGSTTVLYSVPRATLRIHLSEAEEGLLLVVVDPRGGEQRFASDDMTVSGSWLTLSLAGHDGETEVFADGVYQFRVADRAGNVSEREFFLFFRSRRVDPELARDREADGILAILADVLVTDGMPCSVRFSCSTAYQPQGASVRAESGALLDENEQARLEEARPGGALIRIPAMRPGTYRLQLHLEDATNAAQEGTVEKDYDLRVLPTRVVLRLPDSGARFLPALMDVGLLRWEGRVLHQGFAWRLEPDDARLVQGRAWLGDLSQSARLPEQFQPGDALLPPFVPVNGENILGLELADVLGRPVLVLRADQPAPPLHGATADAVVLAEFFYHVEPPAPVDPVIRLEYGQATRLSVHSRLPFTGEDLSAIHLSLAQNEILPEALRSTTDGGTIVQFVLPFPVLVGAANLADLPREQYGRGVTSPARPVFATPAGRQELELTIVTSRSTLAPVSLAEVTTRPLPATLAGIALLPVLAPDGEFRDPVPDDLQGRAQFRAQVPLDVRGMEDFYLQDRELTRAQFAALLQWWTDLPDDQRPDWRQLVHADDPLRNQRLQPGGMLPAWLRGDEARWGELVDSGPARSVAGVDFYQAWTATRLLGLLLAGDPALVRLPVGCELELAALGSAPRGSEVVLNGPAGGARPVQLAAFLESQSRLDELDHPDADEQRAMGDTVATTWSRHFTGLDFGVREWVADLPHSSGVGDEVVGEWLGQHSRHLEKIAEFAAGQPVPRELGGRLKTVGVLRGLAAGEVLGLLDGARGEPLPLEGLEYLPPLVPGVVRTEHLRRDGRDLTPGQLDPRLKSAGFRVVGGSAFVRKVRQR